jgi:ketosteroid isomerase-like protein
MSEEIVERLRAVYTEWAKGNFRAGGELFAPDAVLEQIAEPGSVYRGRDAIADYIREFLAQWSEFRIEAEEVIDAGVVVIVAERQYATGKASGVETETTFYSVWTFDNGLVVKVRRELDRESALEAAGLSE